MGLVCPLWALPDASLKRPPGKKSKVTLHMGALCGSCVGRAVSDLERVSKGVVYAKKGPTGYLLVVERGWMCKRSVSRWAKKAVLVPEKVVFSRYSWWRRTMKERLLFERERPTVGASPWLLSPPPASHGGGLISSEQPAPARRKEGTYEKFCLKCKKFTPGADAAGDPRLEHPPARKGGRPSNRRSPQDRRSALPLARPKKEE